MMRHESTTNLYDEMVLARPIDAESVKIAVSESHRRRLNDFYEMYVRAERLEYFDGLDQYIYGPSRFSGVSRGGTLINVRHRLVQPGQTFREATTLVVAGSLDSDEHVTVTDNYCETVQQVDGSSIQSIHVGILEPESSMRLLVDEFVTTETLRKELDEYVEFGTTPVLTYAHGRWLYHRHDGLIEPMSDIEQVYAEVGAINRRIGKATLRALVGGGEDAPSTGQFNKKVVA